jgi:hypothetical protein
MIAVTIRVRPQAVNPVAKKLSGYVPTVINRGVFPFFMIWSLYPAFPGQAIPSAFGLFGVAEPFYR